MLKGFFKLLVISAAAISLSGCIDELLGEEEDYSYDSYDSSSDSSSSGSSNGSGTSGSYEFQYTCPTPGSDPATAPIPVGPCENQYENYAKAWGCNQVDDFGSTCTALWSCQVNNSEGATKDYYQQYLDTCSAY